MNELKNIVINAQNGENEWMIYIIEKFEPLIKKYSRKLIYDGADSDLTIALIEIIKNIPATKNSRFEEDKYIIGYINTAIKHKYIQLLKKTMTILNTETELVLDVYCDCDYKSNEDLIDNRIFLLSLLDNLSPYQKNIIGGIFFR